MKMNLIYCKRVRKDGSCNRVFFDTESKTFTNKPGDGLTATGVFVEAAMSRDVDAVRNRLVRDGYTDITAA